MMTRFLAPLAALLLATTACAPGASGAPGQPGRFQPAMWSVSDSDTTIYLFGTVHLLPEGVDWRTPRFDRAFRDADTLVLEVVLPEDPTVHAQALQRMAISPGLPPLLQRVPEADREGLRRLVAGSGIPPAALDAMESWAAAVALGSTLYRDSGLSPDRGVERVLQAAAAGKRIEGLETLEEQLGFFDGLPEEAQRSLLVGLVAEAGSADDLFQRLLNAWGTGDLARIAETYEGASGLSPEVADALLARRNAAWTEWVRRRLDRPGTVMMAVGAGHLAGRGSVIERLEAAGLAVRRVQ